MPLFIGDYLADTARLTTEQHGAYLLLIMDYWRNGPPPDDAAVLCQITRLSNDAWSNAQAMLRRFFTVIDGVWRHKRIDKELESAGTKKDRAIDKAKTAAAARWAKVEAERQTKLNASSNAPSNAPSTPQTMLNRCPSPSPSPSEKPNSKSKALASRLPNDWQPNDEDIQFCKTNRPDLNHAAIADAFRDYWIAVAGAKGRKLDWPATWRNWIRNQKAQPSGNGYESAKDKSRREWNERAFGSSSETSKIIDITGDSSRVG